MTSNSPKTIKFKYYQDPGHGWLAVKRKWLEDLKISTSISQYSYQKGKTVYLEEDCDMMKFWKAMNASGYNIETVDVHHKSTSPIRSYEMFQEA